MTTTLEERKLAVAKAREQARSEAVKSLGSLTPDGAKHLAVEIQEACHGNPGVYRRVLEAMERLGVVFPRGLK